MALEMLNNVLRFGALVFYTSPTVVLRMATADVGTMLQGDQLALYNQYTREHEETERKRKERDNKHNSYSGPKRFAGTCHNCGKSGHRMADCNKENKKPSKWTEVAAADPSSADETIPSSETADVSSRASGATLKLSPHISKSPSSPHITKNICDSVQDCTLICDSPIVCPPANSDMDTDLSSVENNVKLNCDNDKSDAAFTEYVDNHIADLINRGYRPVKRNIHSPEAYSFYKDVLGADKKVLDLLKFGYIPKLVKKPPPSIDLRNNKSARLELDFVKAKTEDWLREGVIAQVADKPQFTNPLSVAAKKNTFSGTSKLRMCLDLSRSLNGLLQEESCVMEDITNVIPR